MESNLEPLTMTSKQVLVTGSAGTIGKVAVRALSARGHRVRGRHNQRAHARGGGPHLTMRVRSHTIPARKLTTEIVILQDGIVIRRTRTL